MIRCSALKSCVEFSKHLFWIVFYYIDTSSMGFCLVSFGHLCANQERVYLASNERTTSLKRTKLFCVSLCLLKELTLKSFYLELNEKDLVITNKEQINSVA